MEMRLMVCCGKHCHHSVSTCKQTELFYMCMDIRAEYLSVVCEVCIYI